MNLGLEQILRDEYIYFLQIVEEGSLSRASEKLEIGQPSLSKALAKLEKKIGEKLFFRSRSGLKLTPSGEVLRVQLESLTSRLHHSKNETENVRGSYNIGVHPVVAHFLTPKYLPKLLVEYPKLKIFTHLMESRKALDLVCKGELDFAFVVNPKPLPDLIIHKIVSEKSYIYSQIKNPPVLYYNSEMIQVLSSVAEIKSLQKFKRIESIDSYELIGKLILEKGGAGLLPENLANTFKLKKHYAKSFLNVDICLVYRYELSSNLNAKTLIQEMKKMLKF